MHLDLTGTVRSFAGKPNPDEPAGIPLVLQLDVSVTPVELRAIGRACLFKQLTISLHSDQQAFWVERNDEGQLAFAPDGAKDVQLGSVGASVFVQGPTGEYPLDAQSIAQAARDTLEETRRRTGRPGAAPESALDGAAE